MADMSLSHYVREVMDERNLSGRAFAMYAGVSEATVRRILAGKRIDPETLKQLANHLNLPVDTILRMAGILPEQEQKAELISLVMHFFAKLPPEDQQDILEYVKFRFEQRQRATNTGEPQELTGS